MDILFNSIGLIGMLLLLGAYFLLQRGTVASHDPLYLWMNLTSAVALGISLLWSWNLACFLIECAWVMISVYGLIKLRRGNV